MYECEPDTRNHVTYLKPLTYARYASTPDVLVLHFSECYAQCHRYFRKYQLPNGMTHFFSKYVSAHIILSWSRTSIKHINRCEIDVRTGLHATCTLPVNLKNVHNSYSDQCI